MHGYDSPAWCKPCYLVEKWILLLLDKKWPSFTLCYLNQLKLLIFARKRSWWVLFCVTRTIITWEDFDSFSLLALCASKFSIAGLGGSKRSGIFLRCYWQVLYFRLWREHKEVEYIANTDSCRRSIACKLLNPQHQWRSWGFAVSWEHNKVLSSFIRVH